MPHTSKFTQDELVAVLAVLNAVPDEERKGPLRSAHSKLVVDYQRRRVHETMCLKGELAPVENRPRTSWAKVR